MDVTRFPGLLLALSAASLPIASPTRAAEDDTASGVLSCATLTTDAERLACYDRLAQGLRAKMSSAAHARPTGSAPGVRSTAGSESASHAPLSSEGAAEDVFGLPGGVLPQRTVEPTALKAITAHVNSLQSAPDGLLLQLDNGQSWQQLDNTRLLLHVGGAVRISRAALGSFWLSTADGRGARVKRVR